MADISDRGFSTDVEFCRWLVSEHGVAAVPPSAFYLDAATAPLHARFCFAKRLETIDEARDPASVGVFLSQAPIGDDPDRLKGLSAAAEM